MDTLIDYIEKPDAAEFIDLRSHLASCKQCRHKVSNLSSLNENIHQYGSSLRFNKSNELNAALQAQQIEQYVDNELSDAERINIKDLMQREPQALKAALHYASHSSAMQNAGIGTIGSHLTPGSSTHHSSDTSGNSKDPSVIKTFLNQLGGIFAARPPVWISASATAGVFFALLMFLQPQGNLPTQEMSVATYQDQSVIHFQPTGQPRGIGFFSKALRVTKPFTNIRIQLSKSDKLELKWPKIDKAKAYQLSIKLVGNKETVTVVDQTTEGNQAIIDNFKPQLGKRYEWTLNGETSDAKTFFTSGGFVFNKNAGN